MKEDIIVDPYAHPGSGSVNPRPIVSPHPAVTAIIEAMGFDPSKLTRFVLTVEPDSCVKVEATTFADPDRLMGVVEVVKLYNLVEKAEPKREIHSDPDCTFHYCPTPELCSGKTCRLPA